MITPSYVQTMARYNAWQNGSLYAAAATLTDGARRLDRGAFWRSIQGTLNHLLWGDRTWMSRFAGWPKPELGIGASVAMVDDFATLRAEREQADAGVTAWAAEVSPEWLGQDMTWFSGAAKREMTGPRWLLVSHMFNHQTHHRGQVHAMLTAAGARPEDTDLMLLPPRG
jgi:uncharacterized damage-inducible protein DinB